MKVKQHIEREYKIEGKDIIKKLKLKGKFDYIFHYSPDDKYVTIRTVEKLKKGGIE